MEKLTSRELSPLFEKGRRKRGKVLDLYWMPSDSFKVAVLLTRKVKGSVVRSKTRRRVKEALRLLLPEVKRGCHIAVVVRNGDKDYWELLRELKDLLRSVGLLCGRRYGA
ncbi:MAG: ribonuclease P protein component [Candidatus Latescibacterota bacterium]|nr:MAG: ribonuclease P protein component [Candidatus Latescibacterota bacterium]